MIPVVSIKFILRKMNKIDTPLIWPVWIETFAQKEANEILQQCIQCKLAPTGTLVFHVLSAHILHFFPQFLTYLSVNGFLVAIHH